ncbi:MscS Mechanosensitive ion channel [[Leptolyngbya] sp. PCC 7376]|uniref:mechanosensitive ion channel family protein n=1 Tax=[Leptolyngbya] sp. PCC 7376 TaxID=111781 RepID=UPI00029EF546|nr:mechanosensitive ion channel domain-containing protein [[Leptolyngbya] sp. PCC 7376]AFY39212.1 MscS Mechanosensitive ion channel [[Leptolyngbya] sp. PCC 7376]
MDFGIRFLVALIVLAIGLLVAKVLRNLIKAIMSKAKVDMTITNFVGNLTYIACIALLVVVVLEQIGIATTSFVAVLGAAGLALGLAMQGSLSNFASGFLLVIFRPFKIGDRIEAGGVEGEVEEISLLTTSLTASDNRKIIIPNSKIYNDNIINFSAYPTSRIDFKFTISYDDSIDKAKQIFADVIAKENRILKEPKSKCVVTELSNRGVEFKVKVWVDNYNYGKVRAEINEQVKKEFDRKGLTIPYSHPDAYMYSLQKLRKMFF